MGILQTEERNRAEIDEFRDMLLSYADLHRKKNGRYEPNGKRIAPRGVDYDEAAATAAEERLVCVTGGVSFLGLAVVNRLLTRGFSVRIIIHNHEDMERLREMEASGEIRTTNNKITAVMANLSEVGSLLEAFEGCRGVFHTGAFVDPAGLSGYSKSMAGIEAKLSENVMKACARTTSVRNCVLTSSLLACIWRDNLSPVINHDCWSDESFCIDNKLWYALGKLRAEKAAWNIAKEKGLKLATICPALITGPEFGRRNPTQTIAYLKGAKEMYTDGLLATVDVMTLADAHVSVFEAMCNKTAFGRYICFDRVIGSKAEAEKLAREIEMPTNNICGDESGDYIQARFELSNRKLSCLMSKPLRCYN